MSHVGTTILKVEDDFDYGSESRSDDGQDDGLGTIHDQANKNIAASNDGSGMAISLLKSSSLIDYDKPITVQVTFRGNIVPVSKKAQVISSHPSIVKTKDGKIFQGGATAQHIDEIESPNFFHLRRDD